MKSQTQHIGNYSNVFVCNSFGAPLDGRTIENIFYQEEFTTDTITENVYALEETFILLLIGKPQQPIQQFLTYQAG